MNEAIEEVLISEAPLKTFRDYEEDLGDTKFLLFDNDSNNMSFFENATFGKYKIQGLANYKNTMVIDKGIVNSMSGLTPIKVVHTVDLDSNILGDIQKLFFNSGSLKVNSDLLRLLTLIKREYIQLNSSPYILECGLNNFNLNKEVVFKSLQSFSIMDYIDEETLLSGEYGEFINDNLNLILPESDEKWRQIINLNEDSQEMSLPDYYSTYCMLLKAFYIKNSSKKSVEKKLNEFVDSITTEIFIYSENELLALFMYIDDDERISRFFNGIQPNSKNIFAKMKGMAWDLYHIRRTEQHMAERNISRGIIPIHSFASGDKGLNQIISLNPIKRVAFYKGRSLVVREKNIFEEYPDICSDKIKNSAEERKNKAKETDYKILSKKFEDSIVKLIDDGKKSCANFR
ncbi:hypothetical protein HCB27_02135 [Listeria booriae]|uniref:Uncharacterized protein n=1 Tax=Listeria booriae TaxID=1552123 RepID=A0A7X0Z3Q1_9LIST|nr:hypothetical protein [Listeria booriae]MBC2175401.1 hypothetical protein [Listeria booriae]